MNTLALIGAGNIGSRHLQSLAELGKNWEFTVIEWNSHSMATARKRYQQVVTENSPKPTYSNSLDALPKDVDVCIIATPATGRLELVESILSHSKCRYMILEKVVFQSVNDFAIAENIFNEHGVNVWVNCPRRQWPVFKELKNVLHNDEQIKCHFLGENFAMTCNAIHFIDLFQFITGSAEIVVSGEKLSAPYGDNKRVGSLEFTGTLSMFTARGDNFELSSVDTDRPVSSIMTAKTDSLLWSFKQYELKVETASPDTAWKMAETPGDVPLQSALTASVVRDILENGTCDLTVLSESRLAHVAMFNAFFDRIESATGLRPDICNIT
jgi:predicted dehydrogenase